MTRPRWQDPAASPARRAEALLPLLTLTEKVAQLGSAWPGNDAVSGNVAPMQDVFAGGADGAGYDEAREHGLGHLTRVFGTVPRTVAEGTARIVALQRDIVDNTRLGIPAIVHEECLTGFATYGATVYPTPLAMAATFDAGLIERVASAIGRDLRSVGVHQGLSPVLDVVRDYRWGRVEETLGEDPYLVAMLGAAYVRGIQHEGITATVKHFAGYSASRAARNHAPVSIGPRELRDILLPPFEMAIREAEAGSVMNAYVDLDGVPAAANSALLTGILREEWGFGGVVVSDYWSIPFLQTMHGIADGKGTAGASALLSGVDVELPERVCFGKELVELARSDDEVAAAVDRSVLRLLEHKARLGLLDPGWIPESAVDPEADLDSPHNRALALDVAEKSVVLLANDGTLPLAQQPEGTAIAVVGPCADEALPLLGCYSYPNHVLPRYPDLDPGISVPTVVAALRTELPEATITTAPGCPVAEPDRSGIAEAVALAESARLCVAVVGDKPGMFGEGTSGEGCDVADLRLPGVQHDLLRALLDTGTPVVVVVVSGRPYALGDYERAAALIQAFLPGQRGAEAIAGVVSGRISPSGRLPVQVPRLPGGQPGTYLQPRLGGNSEGISNLDPSPLFPFGHGLSYTEFHYGPPRLDSTTISTAGLIRVTVEIRNVGDRAGAEVVQLYLRDPCAQVTRPVRQLAGFARVELASGKGAEVTFAVHADRTAFTGTDLRRIVEPGTIEVFVGRSALDLPCAASFELTGPVREAGADRVLTTPVSVKPSP
ncbi:glycosyl hydrolase [Prauserella marina]|uniref:Exo-alpha-(1->6)-L-arabinopyranosidase n=1 Tax=Prauserella marina TaxID=530584 RepID=A0A222VT23_9PSEU|nr:glycoside hydrolase family 3 N-terminal domain-containing protein [Prauserella marina]ASR37064.1 glycosyl hydrolase [Prauserella marina]PWV79952.1 beta-glucosidase [Prauserella marina]SDD86336.1 beta-glucosidase [Prauserella marina]